MGAILTDGTRHGGLFYRRDDRKGRGCSSNPRPSLGSRRPEQQLKPKGRGTNAIFNRRDAAQRPILPKGRGTKALFCRRDADTQPPNTHVRAVSSNYRKGRGCSSNPRPSLGSRRPEQQLKPTGRGTDAILTDGTQHGCHINRWDAAWMPC
jgi:hypothetical protein